MNIDFDSIKAGIINVSKPNGDGKTLEYEPSESYFIENFFDSKSKTQIKKFYIMRNLRCGR